MTAHLPYYLFMSLLISLNLWANEANTLTVHISQQPNWFSLDAQIEAVNEATISAQTHGQVQSIHVDVNDYVQADTLIIQLRNTQQTAALKQANAGLSQAIALNNDAQAQLKRAEPLFDKGSLSKGEYDSIKANAIANAARVKASQALVDQAHEQFSYTQIRAPYAGIVKARLVEVGESVSPGTPLMTGLSLNELRAIAHLPQRFIARANALQNMQVMHDSLMLNANNITVFPFANSTSHSFQIRANIKAGDSGLLPGMWVKLMLPLDDISVLRIPNTSVVRQGQTSYVYVKTSSSFVLRQVRLGQLIHTQGGSSFETYVDVLAGLKDGEVIASHANEIMAAQEIQDD